jgi:hypothetical protein
MAAWVSGTTTSTTITYEGISESGYGRAFIFDELEPIGSVFPEYTEEVNDQLWMNLEYYKEEE